MPGRPRTTLKRIDELIQQAEDHGNHLFHLAPSQYLENPDPNDVTAMAWRRAADAAVANCRALYALRERIVAKVERAERSSAV